MDIGFVYTGEKRFEKIGRENHNLLYNTLSEFTPFSIYDQCKADRKNDEFKFELGNPSLQAGLLTIEAITNAPLHGWHQNAFNIQHALSDDYEMWQRAHMLGGWTPFQVGIQDDKKEKENKTKGIKTKRIKTRKIKVKQL